MLRIAIGLAIAAIVPATALAKPMPGTYDRGDIPYSSQGTVQDQVMELGLSQGKIIALGLGGPGHTVAKSPDDRSFSKATSLDTSPVVSGDGRSIDVNAYTVTAFGLAVLLAMGLGMGIAVRQSRKTKLSPA